MKENKKYHFNLFFNEEEKKRIEFLKKIRGFKTTSKLLKSFILEEYRKECEKLK